MSNNNYLPAIVAFAILLSATNVFALETQNLRIAGSWNLPEGQLIGVNGRFMAMRSDDYPSVIVTGYSLDNPLSPTRLSQFQYHYRYMVQNRPKQPKIALTGNAKFIFSTYDEELEEHGALDHLWKIDLLDSSGLRLNNGDAFWSGEDFYEPWPVFDLNGYALIAGGTFQSGLVDLGSNIMSGFMSLAQISTVDCTDSIVVAGSNGTWAYCPSIRLYYYPPSNHPNDGIIGQFDDASHHIRSLVLSGNYIYESAVNDSEDFVRIIDMSDLGNITEIGRLNGFPTPIGRVGDLLMCQSQGPEEELAFYDVSNVQQPTLVASCIGSNLKPYVLSDGTVFAFSDTENKMYVLDRIGLSVQKEGEFVPNSLRLAAFPNPFNSHLIMNFAGLSRGDSHLSVFDQSGRLQIEELIPNSTGRYVWNADQFPAGNYFVKLRSGKSQIVRPVTLLK